MSESYEDLAGALGKERFFRPIRHKATELFSGTPPRLWFEDDEFGLENISLTGAACVIKHQPAASLETAKTGILRFTQRGREILRVQARIARTAPVRNGVLVGFTLDEADFDLSALRHDNARAISATASTVLRTDAVSSEYKSFCADVLDFVGYYLQHINQFYGPIEKEMSDADSSQLVFELANAAETSWKALIKEGNSLVIPLHRDKKNRLELKAYTERVVTPAFLEGEGWARSYYKPLGYPGDYRIMNYIYEGTALGPTIKAKFLHQLSLVGSAPVRVRMEQLSRMVVDAASKASGETFNIMSIGSGPARELKEIAAGAPSNVKLNATLIDQDRHALDFAVASAHQAASRDRLSISALNISFKDMLNPASIGDLLGNMDVIYSAGLVDYLNPLLAQRFLKRVYQYLKPGGKLIVGNLNDLDSGMIWPCEYITDWNLYFRNEAEMHAMAREMPDAKTVVRSDPSGAIYFLTIDKPFEA